MNKEQKTCRLESGDMADCFQWNGMNDFHADSACCRANPTAPPQASNLPDFLQMSLNFS
jgi:hypothetical protein